ncbi:hypothetical protein PDO_3983 [Rhizobium sp. PDO1-076]|nr:hypothetical protein PDO_3983 [Rhizobium sp. PDO1-076]
MRIGESSIYSSSYSIQSKNNSGDANAQIRAPLVTTSPSVGVEADTSAKGLSSNLWLLQTDVYYSKDAEKAAAGKEDLAAEFRELSEKSAAERIREDYLESHGLTEEDLAAMSDEERQAIEDDIQQLIKRQLGFDEKAVSEDSQVGA